MDDDGRRSKRRRDPPPPSAGEAGPSRTRKTKRANEEEEVVDAIARALTAYLASSRDAAVSFVRRVTPATVVRCIDGEHWAAASSSEMSGSLLNDRELEIFLKICVEEDAANNIPGDAPDPDECRNIARKMREKTGKAFTQEQIRNEWDHAHRRFTNWCWLMGIDDNTATVHAIRKGTNKYKRVLEFFENNRVPAARNVGGNYGHVAGGGDDAVDVTGVGAEGWTQGGGAAARPEEPAWSPTPSSSPSSSASSDSSVAPDSSRRRQREGEKTGEAERRLIYHQSAPPHIGSPPPQGGFPPRQIGGGSGRPGFGAHGCGLGWPGSGAQGGGLGCPGSGVQGGGLGLSRLGVQRPVFGAHGGGSGWLGSGVLGGYSSWSGSRVQGGHLGWSGFGVRRPGFGAQGGGSSWPGFGVQGGGLGWPGSEDREVVQAYQDLKCRG
ncbi:uncharacterized protein LOC127785899 [Oryza glaberrima]|uniref:uncharacterized protein LOC127785899 n=1 Tax=Oryza glaberrima TaxID=4538 RepID=UPI00224C1E3F|nr:uncharacterized protein LOC127785899 [Oryza glaberrima]